MHLYLFLHLCVCLSVHLTLFCKSFFPPNISLCLLPFSPSLLSLPHFSLSFFSTILWSSFLFYLCLSFSQFSYHTILFSSSSSAVLFFLSFLPSFLPSLILLCFYFHIPYSFLPFLSSPPFTSFSFLTYPSLPSWLSLLPLSFTYQSFLLNSLIVFLHFPQFLITHPPILFLLQALLSCLTPPFSLP